ncbi:MAG: lamin tail domain-containing protein, partial [Limisphaerales bacterium]
LQGLSYTFPDGSTLGPTNFVVLAVNDAAFAGAYGATNPVFDVLSEELQPGQLLSLVKPDNNGTNDLIVTQVKYDALPPWPTDADGNAASLQLIDPNQDNWRAGNWAAVSNSATPDAVNAVAASLTPFPPLWINEVQPDNLTGITNKAGQRAAWVELFNPSANIVPLTGIYLANNYTNLLQWAFPTNSVIGPGQFDVIFADAQTNLSSSNELHTSFILTSGTGAVALTRLTTNGQQQVLDYVNYANIIPNDSYGSFPDGQSFYRQEFFQATPGASNDGTATPPPSFIDYDAVGSVYTQDFDWLPDPGSSSVNADNPVAINGVTYSLANPYDFAFPSESSGSGGGLGIAGMAGWYGTSADAAQFGATYGDQTTGGQISFGPPNSSNRALGLLATSSTKGTAFGVRFINGTGQTLNFINLQFAGEVWRQSNVPKTLQFYYFVDPTGLAGFSKEVTAYLPALDVNIPTVSTDTGGVAVDGTSPLNQTNLAVLNQSITNWTPGAALWLVWQMTDSTGKAQGLGIDNLGFSASVLPTGFVAPPLTAHKAVGTNYNISCLSVNGLSYQLEYNTNLTTANWLPIASPISGTGDPITFTITLTNSQQFFRVRISP